MKKVLLLMMTLVLAALGAKAEPVKWEKEIDGVTYKVEFDSNVPAQGPGANNGFEIKVNAPGALAAFIADEDNTEKIAVIGNINSNKLTIKAMPADPPQPGVEPVCELNADDFSALSNTAFGHFTTLNLTNTTFESVSTMSGMNMSGLEYLRLPNSMTTAKDVAEMKSLKTGSNNASLKVVGAYDPSPSYGADVAMHSFVANSVPSFLTQMNIPTSGNPNPVPRKIRMSGEYGENDLVNNGTPNFGYGTSAEWDFTGAHFADCTIAQGQTKYYNYDDPFCDNGLVAPFTSSNTFCFFAQYRKQVVDIKLPDNNMKNLPASCLEDMGAENKSGYVAMYGQAAFDANKVEATCVPIETLVIPNCYSDIEQECCMWARIRHVVIGSGMKRVHGGAFLKCDYLEDLDFAPGLKDCYLGDKAFNECKSMKHIALAEGIVSLGAGCFYNSQHLESIRLPETLINIGNNCFDNCLALGNITIPSNVAKIGMQAFKLTALRNVYLTTTDPDKVPIIYTGGTDWDSGDAKSTFSINEMEGYNTIPWNDTNPYSDGLHTMTWAEAIEWYYVHVNCMTILHYPEQLATKVRAQISGTYGTTSSDGFGLPIKDADGNNQAGDIYDDRVKRATGSAPGLNLPAVDLGSPGQGKWTNDGWIQFLLMEEYNPQKESKVYTKNYKDVWYTMCFPFELTDEQLASAFNEGFNIADFSGIQIKDPNNPDDEVEKKTIVLHFNKVAETLYKDSEKNLYERKRDANGVIRERDGAFDYNIYIDKNGQEYHHVIVAKGEAAATKTKTFAPGNSLSESLANKDQAIVIDGYLASAGHPYMIHPNTGTVPEADPVPCHFSGITWVESTDENKTTDQVRAELYEAEKRTVDLGVANTNNNFDQKAYDGYTGQTYTFKGNHKMYRDGYEAIVGPEPTFNQVKPVEPIIPETRPTEPEEVEEPTAPTNPATNPKYTDDFKTLFQTVRCSYTGWHAATQDQNHLYEFTYGEDLVNCSDSQEFLEFRQWHNNVEVNSYFYKTQASLHNSSAVQNINALKAVLGDEPIADLDGFNALKQLATDYTNDLASYETDYANYQSELAAYNVYQQLLTKYQKDLYNFEHSEEVLAAYRSALDAYNDAYDDYLDEYEAWEQSVASYKVLIPKYAYFLGTKKGETFPRYFREMAPDDQPRTTGIWSQYAAVIIPNTAALNGLEKELGNTSTTSQAKSHPIAFDEEYFFLDDTPQGIATLIEKIEKEEGKADVQYMDIVVSIDGKVISRDKTAIEGLPKGVYIINGKKYYVK